MRAHQLNMEKSASTAMARKAQYGPDEDLARIGEIAAQFDVTLRTLRFYEDKGLLSPRRVGASRFYGRRERARLKLILLGRDIGFSLEDIREMLDLYEPATGNKAQLSRVLEKADEQMRRLEQQRAALDEAMARLRDSAALARRQLDKIG